MVPKIARIFVVVTIGLGLVVLVLGIVALVMMDVKGGGVMSIAAIVMGLALMIVGMTLRGVLDAVGQMGQGMAEILKALNAPR